MFRFIRNVQKNSAVVRTSRRAFSSEQETVQPSVTDQPESAMTPKKIVEYLNSFIIGQQDAKRSMAIALSI